MMKMTLTADLTLSVARCIWRQEAYDVDDLVSFVTLDLLLVLLSREANNQLQSADENDLLSFTKIKGTIFMRGRLARVPTKGILDEDIGKLVCIPCRQMPECFGTCPTVIYYCIFAEKTSMTRCGIHLGFHKHPIAKGKSKNADQAISDALLHRAAFETMTTAKQLERTKVKEIIMDNFVTQSCDLDTPMGDEEFSSFLDAVTPLSHKRRV
ncbi:hypothetical protein L7F22_061494 [Adiantum nelumboides]|nr:hypothetical protein [Adiantum nelumboides]